MTQATIEITGLGPVAINTELDEVVLVGALTISGAPVNCKKKKVSRNQGAANRATQIENVWLREIQPGYFILTESSSTS